jgi:MFS family permease
MSYSVPGSYDAPRLDPRFAHLWTSTLVASFAFHLLTARLPLYAVGLGADDVAVGLLTGLIAGVALVGRPTVGWLMDGGLGRSIGIGALYIGVALYALTGLGYWWAPTVSALLTFRALAGVAVSFHGVASHTLVTHLVPLQRRGEMLGVYALASTAAQGLAPAIGVSVAHRAGDSVLFAGAVGLNVVALALAWRLRGVQRPPAARPRGTVINGAVLVPGLLMLAIMATFGTNFALLPIHAGRRGLGNPGGVFVAHSIGLLIAQSFAGRLSDRFGRLAVVGPGLMVTAAGMVLTSLLSGAWLYVGVALAGIGLGACQPALQALAADLVPSGERGTAMGTMGVFHEIGVIFGAVGGGFIGRQWGLGATYLVAAAVAIVGATSAFALHRARAFGMSRANA